MIKRAVLLIVIASVLCFGLWGYVRPVQAAASITWVKQNPIEPVHGIPVTVWVNFSASSGETPVLEYKINGISLNVNGAEDVPLGFDANWRFDIPAQVKGTTVSYQLFYRNADNSMGGITGFIWSYTVKVLDAVVDRLFDDSTPGFGRTAFNNIQAAVTSVDAGATIKVNTGTYNFPTPIVIVIDKPLTILGIGSDTDVPLINGKIILSSLGITPGKLKLFNLRFAEANGAITIGNVADASFDQVELSYLSFGTTAVADSKAIQTSSSVQIKNLSILNCEIYAAHGIDLNGDFGSAAIKFNNFYLTAQTAGSFDAIMINQDTKASASVIPLGKLTVQGNTLNKPATEDNPFVSAILNQSAGALVGQPGGKSLISGNNTLRIGSTIIIDETQFINDLIANPVNNAPVADNQTISTSEDIDLAITLAVADANGDELTYTVVTNPKYGTFSGTAPSLTYKPSANYYGTDNFTFKANDGTADSNVATVTITISAVNDAPTLTAIPAKTVNEGELLTFTAAGSDVDLPAQAFIYSFSVTAPDGMLIDAARGEVTWTPTEAQGPQGYSVKVCVSDGAVTTPTCQDVAVTVNEVNLPPALTAIPNKTVKEGELLTFIATGSDGNLPLQTLTYSFSGDAPDGMQIDAATGSVTWTPAEAQGPQDYTVKVCVSDGAVTTPTCQDVAVTVNEVNLPPVITAIPAQNVMEGAQLTFAVSGTDADLPKQVLSFSIVNAPTGSVFDTAIGAFSWTPGEGQGSLTYYPSVCVSDGMVTTPTCQEVTITVGSVNVAPTMDEITDKAINEGEPLTFTATASDTDLPKQALSYSFSVTAPDGMQIDAATGSVTWTPAEAQGPQDYTVKVCVSDGAVTTPACQDVAVTVNEVNLPPALTAIPAKTVKEGEPLTFTATAIDTDLPKQALSYSFSVTAPDGMLIDTAKGEVTWTPTEAQGPQGYTVKVCVSDGAVTTPACQDVAVTVNEVKLPPALTAIPAKIVKEGELLTFIAAGSDGNLPLQTLTYSFSGDAPDGMQIDAATGSVTWTPAEAQGPQDYTVKVCVSDGAVTTPTCQDVAVTVNEVNLPPTLTTIPNKTVKEGELLTFTAVGSDSDVDIPAQALAFTLQDAPDGGVIDPDTGVFTWTPGEGQGPQDYTVKVCVSDGTLTTCQEVIIRISSLTPQHVIKIYLPLISR